MRLDYGVIRELHWHKEAEWAYVLDGNVRVTGIDTEGGMFIDDLQKGDLWYFPSGHPHSLQGLSENGTEFLLVFDDGNFNEESTFLLTDWLGKSTHCATVEVVLTCSSTHSQGCPRRELPNVSSDLQNHGQVRQVHLPR
jgi:oxalate decarboxylase family bicupin protein